MVIYIYFPTHYPPGVIAQKLQAAARLAFSIAVSWPLQLHPRCDLAVLVLSSNRTPANHSRASPSGWTSALPQHLASMCLQESKAARAACVLRSLALSAPSSSPSIDVSLSMTNTSSVSLLSDVHSPSAAAFKLYVNYVPLTEHRLPCLSWLEKVGKNAMFSAPLTTPPRRPVRDRYHRRCRRCRARRGSRPPPPRGP